MKKMTSFLGGAALALAVAGCQPDEAAAPPADAERLGGEVELDDGRVVSRLARRADPVLDRRAPLDVDEAAGVLAAVPDLRLSSAPRRIAGEDRLVETVYCGDLEPGEALAEVERAFAAEGWSARRDARAPTPVARLARGRYEAVAVAGRGRLEGCAGDRQSFVALSLFKHR